MKITKKVSIMLVATLCLSLLAGCAGGNNSKGNDVEKGEITGPIQITEPTTITFWHTHTDQGVTALANAMAAYKEKFPNVTVSEVYQGTYGELAQKLTAAQAAQTLPSLTVLESANIPEYAESGFMQDLGPYIKADNVDLKDFAEGMLAAYNYDNKQVAIPYMVSTQCLIYNKDAVDAEGLKVPQTWDEMEEFLSKGTKFDASGKPTRQAMAIGAWDTWYYEPFFINQGVNLINPDNTTDIASEKSIGILSKFKEWMDKGYLQLPYGKGASTNMRQAFMDGQLLSVVHTTALIDMYKDNASFDIGVSFLPGADKRISFIGGCGILIPAKVPEKEKLAAWTYINFVTSSDYNIKWATEVGYMPTRHSSVSSDAGKEFLQNKPQYGQMLQLFDNVTTRIRHPSYSELSGIYKEAVGKVALENADPKEVLKDAETKMNDIFKEIS